MRTLKLRQAEVALHDGRLDEAYDLLIVSDTASHRRGQALTTQLIQKLKDRIQQHRTAERFEAALKDCDRAHRLGGNQSDLAELREGILAELAQRNDRESHRRRIHREARERIVNGDLTLGHALCRQLPDATQERQFLSAEIEIKQQVADKSIERAESALRREDWEDAVTALCEAKACAAHNQRVKELIRQTAQSVLEQARSDLRQGQLACAQMRLFLARRLVDQDLQLAALSDILHRCQEASDCIRHDRLTAAREQLQAAGQLLADADWIDSTLDLIERAQTANEALRASPLSLLLPASSRSHLPSWSKPVPHSRAEPTAGSASGRLLVQVDGAGRMMAIGKPAIRLGPPNTGIDLQLQINRSLPSLLIERTDDDYFMSTAEPVQLNGRSTTSGLLSDGDQITIGSRCGIKFRLPCAASRTALLQITGSRLDPRDVRTVILMDDAFLIGPDTQSHIRVRHIKRRFAVVRREGRLYVQPVAAERASEQGRRPIELGVAVDLGGTTLLIDDADG